MSIESVAWALNLTEPKLTAAQKLVLIGICNHDGDGGAWPSIATLCVYSGLDRRTVIRRIRDLEDLGLIVTEVQEGGVGNRPKHSRPNLYRVIHRDGTHATPFVHRDGTHATRGMAPTPPGGVAPTPPEPSVEPSEKKTPDPQGGTGGSTPPEHTPRQVADEVVRAWWDWAKERTGQPPTAQSYISVVKVVERLLKAGYTVHEVKMALVDVPTVSIGWMESTIKKSRDGGAGVTARVTTAPSERNEWMDRSAEKRRLIAEGANPEDLWW